MGQIKLISGMIMAALFTLSIVIFAAQFGVDNDASVMLTDDSDYDGLNDTIIGEIRDINEDANSSVNTLMGTTQDLGDQSATSGGQFKVTVSTVMGILTTQLGVGFAKIFGEDTGFGILLTAITSLLLWMIGLYVWKTWKGNPD